MNRERPEIFLRLLSFGLETGEQLQQRSRPSSRSSMMVKAGRMFKTRRPRTLEPGVDEDRARGPEVSPHHNNEDLVEIQGEAADLTDLEVDQDRVDRAEIPPPTVPSRSPTTVEFETQSSSGPNREQSAASTRKALIPC
jgi:hypothetical protein